MPETQQKRTTSGLKLAGPKGNPAGLGAKVAIWYKGQQQYAEQALQRGYTSTVEPFIHFGLGQHTTIDSLTVTWPGAESTEAKAGRSKPDAYPVRTAGQTRYAAVCCKTPHAVH